MKIVITVMLCLWSFLLMSQPKDPTIFYIDMGDAVNPWEASLQFGQARIEEGKASTIRNSLVLKEDKESGHLQLTWSPKNIKNEWGSLDENVLTFNLINRMNQVDISSVVDQAALMVEIQVERAPKELVELTLECAWNWKCRSSYPLKNILRKIPEDQFFTLPIPLQCFSNKEFDFSKLTGLMLKTTGKMQVSIKNISLGALPSDFSGC